MTAPDLRELKQRLELNVANGILFTLIDVPVALELVNQLLEIRSVLPEPSSPAQLTLVEVH